MPPRATRLAAAVVALTLAALASGGGCACGRPFRVTDSFTEPPGAFEGPIDSLHDYAVGTEVGLQVRGDAAFLDLDKVEIVSRNPDLVEVLSQERIKDGDNRIDVRIKALAAGTAALAFLDDRQRPIEERVIQVVQPDQITLSINMDAERGFTLPTIDGDDLLLAVSGSVTFRVAYAANGTEVKGVGVLVGASPDYIVENPTRSLPDREFMTLRSGNVPTELVDVALSVAAPVVRTLRVRTTPLEEISSIQLDEGELPFFRNDGDVFTVWGKAFTTDGAPVFGAPFSWTFDSAGVEGSGDLVSYTRQGGERRLLQARAGDITEDVTIEARAGTAQTSSTEDPGCAAAPAPVIAALLALLSRRRRRAESAVLRRA